MVGLSKRQYELCDDYLTYPEGRDPLTAYGERIAKALVKKGFMRICDSNDSGYELTEKSGEAMNNYEEKERLREYEKRGL